MLNIAQYDLSTAPAIPNMERSLREPLRRIATKARANVNKLKKLTSSTGLMGILAYLAIEEILEKKGLYMYLEPELIEFERTFDYAVVDERTGFVAMLVEIKRLSSIQNLPEYGESFIEKIQDLMIRCQSCQNLSLHLHMTPAIVSGEKDLEVFEAFAETTGRMIRKITEDRIEVFLTSSYRGFNLFKETLGKRVRNVLDRTSRRTSI